MDQLGEACLGLTYLCSGIILAVPFPRSSKPPQRSTETETPASSRSLRCRGVHPAMTINLVIIMHCLTNLWQSYACERLTTACAASKRVRKIPTGFTFGLRIRLHAHPSRSTAFERIGKW
jgi:hypothetical protein